MRKLVAGLLFCLVASCNGVNAQDHPAIRTETLLKTTSSWDGTPYVSYPQAQPELTVLKITIPAHTRMTWHEHPMPNAGYVVSGRLTVEKKTNGEKRVLTAGQVLPEMVDALHRGTTGDTPVVLIVFYAGTPGMPLSIPEK
jgi:quercetin dioxygenase-like cupin family protein